MKRSQSFTSSTSTSNSSLDNPIQSERPKSKRAKKGKTSAKCLNPNNLNSSKRSSIYRGVTRHRWTGRFEAHLWDKSSWNTIQNKKGKQVYLGAYDSEEAAARTYDLAALKYWGPETILNFSLETYTKEIDEMQKVSKEEYLASLRRQSSGFSRGVSKYRGVARHHHNGRWEARIGRVFGNKYLYLGTYNTQEEAAAAYDMAAIEYRGANAVTNFDISNYIDRLKNKGIFPLPLNQTQEPIPELSIENSQLIEDEQDQKQSWPEPNQPEDQTQLQEQDVQETDIKILDPEDSNNELAWSFCMDSGLHPFLSDREFPIEKSMELPDLFDEIGFEDNIDFMFDEMNAVEGIVVNDVGNDETPTSPGDSPSSTTTSVSCSYSVRELEV